MFVIVLLWKKDKDGYDLDVVLVFFKINEKINMVIMDDFMKVVY